ncbi:MAG TPA: MT-A70 family methyltransferase, partial [Candidatus Paceibacterota bacterium]|nr:MT-A70 family methyltransferase [Candidatus Paceibacterota bacterium]
CILAIKGKPYFHNETQSTIFSEKRTTHSTKPEKFYEIVNEICAGRKLDYFARKKREGWDVYGDEV